ncbi:hypothetical protein JF66_12070 [Cryobacterium sp. MLB-32]|nr:hypothetical protein JF66_12070 [Cryobacterium sp. MLB-32]
MITTRTSFLAAAAIAAALTLSSCAVAAPAPAPGAGSTSSPSSSTGAFNDADVLFAQLMIPHHEQAVEMSDDLLAKEGVDSRVTDIATAIKAAQQPEIDQMQGWLTQWGAEETDPSGMGGMGDMGDGGMGNGSNGMMSDDDMMALRDSSAADAGALFLRQMIMHHEGAIVMAKAEIADGESAEAQALAEAIVSSQTAEIAQMNDLLAAL